MEKAYELEFVIAAMETSVTMGALESLKKLSNAKPVDSVRSGRSGDHFHPALSLVERVRGQELANVSMVEREKSGVKEPPLMLACATVLDENANTGVNGANMDSVLVGIKTQSSVFIYLVTCDRGTQQRTRECINGRPGDVGCPGSDFEAIPCEEEACIRYVDYPDANPVPVECDENPDYGGKL